MDGPRETGSDARISYLPTDGLSYDPSEPVYWEEGALAREVTRVFEVCHGCRMCFKYCDSFPTLFSLVDDVAEWFETLAKAEKSHAGRFQKALDEIK